MRTLHYSLASLKYHQKSYRLFWILGSLLATFVFFTFLLLNSQRYFGQAIKALLKNINGHTLTKDFTTESATLSFGYRTFLVCLMTIFLISYVIFAWRLQKKRRQEIHTMKAAGTSSGQYLWQLTLEAFLPIAGFCLVISLITLVCQNLLITFLEDTHIKVTELMEGRQSQAIVANGQQTNWMIMMPSRLTLVIKNVLIDGQTWFALVLKSFGQTLASLFLAITSCLIGLYPFLKRRMLREIN